LYKKKNKKKIGHLQTLATLGKPGNIG